MLLFHAILGCLSHLVLLAAAVFFLLSGEPFQALVLLGFVSVVSTLVAIK